MITSGPDANGSIHHCASSPDVAQTADQPCDDTKHQVAAVQRSMSVSSSDRERRRSRNEDQRLMSSASSESMKNRGGGATLSSVSEEIDSTTHCKTSDTLYLDKRHLVVGHETLRKT